MAQQERLEAIADAIASRRALEAERLWRSFAAGSFSSAADRNLSPTIAYVLHASLELAPPAELGLRPEGGTPVESARLQNMLQTHQQTLQMLSNMSKKMHDTASNVIQNFRH